jgi:hypothetical protein
MITTERQKKADFRVYVKDIKTGIAISFSVYNADGLTHEKLLNFIKKKVSESLIKELQKQKQ